MNEANANIKLLLVEPRAEDARNFVVAFTSSNKNEGMAYNWAIESILKRENLSPFHHHDEELAKQHKPGYHEWEIREESDKENLERLVSEMEERAKEIEDIFRHFGAEVE